MAAEQQRQKDIEDLKQMNLMYLKSDQTSDVATYETFLDPNFTVSLADAKLYHRKEFLEMIAGPRPFTELSCQDVDIGLFGDNNVALVRARFSFRNLDGKLCHGRHTDEYQRQNGKWICIGANVICNDV
ncbi:hypothetical protein GGI43DRAFT_386902 [Trichoderma evansii]